MAQASLFGTDGMPAPEQRLVPTADEVRGRLRVVIDQARAADAMPWNEREARMWRRVVPNMVRWLPEDEAACVLAAFEREVARLEG